MLEATLPVDDLRDATPLLIRLQISRLTTDWADSIPAANTLSIYILVTQCPALD
jgi:hypothetical protein